MLCTGVSSIGILFVEIETVCRLTDGGHKCKLGWVWCLIVRILHRYLYVATTVIARQADCCCPNNHAGARLYCPILAMGNVENNEFRYYGSEWGLTVTLTDFLRQFYGHLFLIKYVFSLNITLPHWQLMTQVMHEWQRHLVMCVNYVRSSHESSKWNIQDLPLTNNTQILLTAYEKV